jgi:hypothetical protein
MQVGIQVVESFMVTYLVTCARVLCCMSEPQTRTCFALEILLNCFVVIWYS